MRNGKRIFLLFSHNLTNEQVQELEAKYNIENFIYLPDEYQYIWSNITPEGELPLESIDKIVSYLDEQTSFGDYLLVQGEPGVTFYIASWALDNLRIPIYSTTNRLYQEEKGSDGSIKNIHFFKHINFREYRR